MKKLVLAALILFTGEAQAQSYDTRYYQYQIQRQTERMQDQLREQDYETRRQMERSSDRQSNNPFFYDGF